MLNRQKYQKVTRFFPAPAAGDSGDARTRRHPRLQNGGHSEADCCGNFLDRLRAVVVGEFEWTLRAIRPYRRGVLDHRARRKILRLGKIQLAGHRQYRSRSAGPKREPQSRRVARAARIEAGPVHRDSGALRRARSGRFALFRFFRYGRDGQALLPERSNGPRSGREEHHALGRRLPPAAARRTVGRRRRAARKSVAGRSGRADESGVLSRDGEKTEEETDGPRIYAAQRIWRSARESRFLGRRFVCGRR